jgi:ATP-dependent DNA ligase
MRLVDEAPAGGGWLHEIKDDGYRMHARIEGAQVKLLTRMGLNWSHRYKRTIEALGSQKVKSAYLDGEMCALNADGVPCSAGSRRQWRGTDDWLGSTTGALSIRRRWGH